MPRHTPPRELCEARTLTTKVGRQGKRARRRSVPKWLVELRNSETVNSGPGGGSSRKINHFNKPSGVVRLPQLIENHESP